jgi:hypothetical protein
MPLNHPTSAIVNDAFLRAIDIKAATRIAGIQSCHGGQCERYKDESRGRRRVSRITDSDALSSCNIRAVLYDSAIKKIRSVV